MRKKKNGILAAVIASVLVFSSLNSIGSYAAEKDDDNCGETEQYSSNEQGDLGSGCLGTIGPSSSSNNGDTERVEGDRSSGWQQESNGKWRYYYSNGTYATGWTQISGHWYYFDSSGYMHTGWLEYQNHWYYFEPKASSSSYGQMVTGWKKITVSGSQDWYYFNSNGTMKTGWLSYNNHWYFFRNTNGKMVIGWYNIQGYTYFFNEDGEYEETTRRAIIIGDDITERGKDMIGWSNCLSHLTFMDETFARTEMEDDLTYAELSTLLSSVMSSAQDGDITYISITCHGGQSGTIRISSNCTISGQQLRSLLNPYKGKVVLFLNCCYAGQIIRGTDLAGPEMDFLSAFTDETDSGELIDNKYLVLCSAAYDELSYKYRYNNTSYYIAYANEYWTKGGGWDLVNSTSVSMYADSNNNSIVTLDELYDYSSANITSQHVVVYPENSNFTIFARN